MEYLVIMTTHIPEGTPEEDVQEIRKRDAVTLLTPHPSDPVVSGS